MKIEQLFETAYQSNYDILKQYVDTNLIVTSNNKSDPPWIVTNVPKISYDQYITLYNKSFPRLVDTNMVGEEGPFMIVFDSGKIQYPNRQQKDYIWVMSEQENLTILSHMKKPQLVEWNYIVQLMNERSWYDDFEDEIGEN